MKYQVKDSFSIEESQEFFSIPSILALIISADGKIHKSNDPELEGKPIESLIHFEDIETTVAIIGFLVSGTRKSIKDMRNRCLGKNGEYRWFSWSAKFSDGKVYATGSNVTQEVTPSQGQGSHTLILDNITEGVAVYDENYAIVYANRAEEQLFGYEPGELIGKGMMILSHPQALKERHLVDVAESIEKHGKFGGEWANMHKDGSLIYTAFRVSTFYIDGQKHYICVHRDIMEKRRTEQMVNILTERLTLAVKAGKIGIWEWVPNTDNIKWDGTIEETYGYELGTFPGTTEAYSAGIYPADIDNHWKVVIQAIETKTSFTSEYRIVRRDGKIRWVQGSGMAFYNENNVPTLMIGTCQDITARKQVSDDQIFLGKISELLATSFDYTETLLAAAKSAVGYFCDGCQIEVFNTDGRIERIAAGKDTRNSKQKSIVVSDLKGRERILGTLTFIALENSMQAFDDRTNYLSEEVSYRISMSLENSLLYQMSQDAVRARDQFVSIASHELKTPLTSLLLQNQMRIRQQLKLNSEALSKVDFEKMLNADYHHLKRILRLIDDMLDISRIRGGQLHIERENFEFGQFVNDVVERFLPQAEAAGGKISYIRCKETVVSADMFRIEQVLANVLTNAIKYGRGKPIKVEIQLLDKSLKLFVHDEGPGIASEDQERIFLRFERAASRNDVSGLGLGLYISKEIMEQHNGYLTVMSEIGKGSSFILELPL